MEIDEFLDLVKKRRSIRRFKPHPIPDEYIEKMLEAARWAMSGADGQPWEFIVIKDRETKAKIAELYTESRKETYYIEQTRAEELRHHQFRTFPKGLPGFKDAPVLILVCGDRRTLQATVLSPAFVGGDGGAASQTYLMNIANAIQLLHLTAAALGLGSQWVSIGQALKQPLKVLLDIPDLIEVHTLVPVGYPAYEPVSSYRRELWEITHYERYDCSKYRTGEDIIEWLRKLRRMTEPSYAQQAGLP